MLFPWGKAKLSLIFYLRGITMKKVLLAVCITFALLLFGTFQTFAQWSTDPTVNNTISSTTGSQYSPNITDDGSGGAIIAWLDQRNSGTTGTDIYAQRINSSGSVQWTTNGLVVCDATGNQTTVLIVSDGSGGAILAWIDSRDYGTSGYDIYAQRINSSGTPQWTANGVAVCTNSANQQTPKMVSDGNGGVIIVWEDDRGSDTDIYAQKLNSSGTPQWTSDGVAVCTATDNQNKPDLTTDGSGGAIFAWQDSRNGGTTGLDIYTQRITSAGSVNWTANGVLICNETLNQQNTVVVSDENNGAIIIWNDPRDNATNGFDIYAQRVNSSGTAQWTAGGVALCSTTGNQQFASATSTGDGGAIVAWDDYRNGSSNVDIYAQRVDASGNNQWTSTGAAVCTNSGNQLTSHTVPYGTDGAVIVWTDARDYGTNFNDIYGQRLNSSGAMQWTSSGVAICTNTANQLSVAFSDVGVVTWYDTRNGDSDVFATQISPDGSLGGGSLPVELTSLNAAVVNNSVKLIWHTATEVNNYGFEVERKSDNSSWTKIGFVNGSGNSNSDKQYSFTDNNVEAGGSYDYRLKQIDLNGQYQYSDVVSINVSASTEAKLYQNSPNPFNPSTAIKFYIPQTSDVTIKIYDMLGREVTTLFNKQSEAGSHITYWNGRDRYGREAASGVYLYRLTAGSFTETKKMLMMK